MKYLFSWKINYLRPLFFLCALLFTARSGFCLEKETIVQVFPSSATAVIGEKFPVKIKIIHGSEPVGKIIVPRSQGVVFRNVLHKKGYREDMVDADAFFYDIGEVEVPPFQFAVSTKIISAGAFKVIVRGALSGKETELKKIRGQQGGGFPVWIILLIIASAALLFWILRRRKKKNVAREERVSPEEWYLAELAKIKTEDDAGRVLDHLSDLFRVFLEKKYALAAIYLSSGEIIAVLKKSKLESFVKMKVAAFLHSCDLAKFAKKNYEKNEIAELLEQAKSFSEIGALR
ncbi:MAG: LPXTG cell wall anchor domain-containing protein [bacterium]